MTLVNSKFSSKLHCNSYFSYADTPQEKFEEEDLRKLLTNLSQHFKGNEGNRLKGVIKQLLIPGGANVSGWRLYEMLQDASKGVYTRVAYKPKDSAKQEDDDDHKENAIPVKVKEAVKLPLPNEFVTHFVGECIVVFSVTYDSVVHPGSSIRRKGANHKGGVSIYYLTKIFLKSAWK